MDVPEANGPHSRGFYHYSSTPQTRTIPNVSRRSSMLDLKYIKMSCALSDIVDFENRCQPFSGKYFQLRKIIANSAGLGGLVAPCRRPTISLLPPARPWEKDGRIKLRPLSSSRPQRSPLPICRTSPGPSSILYFVLPVGLDRARWKTLVMHPHAAAAMGPVEDHDQDVRANRPHLAWLQAGQYPHTPWPEWYSCLYHHNTGVFPCPSLVSFFLRFSPPISRGSGTLSHEYLVGRSSSSSSRRSYASQLRFFSTIQALVNR